MRYGSEFAAHSYGMEYSTEEEQISARKKKIVADPGEPPRNREDRCKNGFLHSQHVLCPGCDAAALKRQRLSHNRRRRQIGHCQRLLRLLEAVHEINGYGSVHSLVPRVGKYALAKAALGTARRDGLITAKPCLQLTQKGQDKLTELHNDPKIMAAKEGLSDDEF